MSIYEQVYKIDPAIDIAAIAIERGEESDPVSIENGWRRFWNADQRTESIYYSRLDADRDLAEMISEFINDCLAANRDGIVSEFHGETFPGKVARETGLELIGEPKAIVSQGFSYVSANW